MNRLLCLIAILRETYINPVLNI